MPLVEVTLVEGRQPERLRELIARLTEVVETTLEVPGPSVHVVLREVPATHWADGDLTVAERRAAAERGPQASAATEDDGRSS